VSIPTSEDRAGAAEKLRVFAEAKKQLEAAIHIQQQQQETALAKTTSGEIVIPRPPPSIQFSGQMRVHAVIGAMSCLDWVPQKSTPAIQPAARWRLASRRARWLAGRARASSQSTSVSDQCN